MKILISLIIITFLTPCCKSQEISCENYFNNDIDDYVYTKLTTRPAFVGGDHKLLEYFYENLIYPEGEIQSRVILKLIFDEKGRVISVKIKDKKSVQVSPVEYAVIDVFLSSPQWSPGLCDSRFVKSEIFYPLRINTDL